MANLTWIEAIGWLASLLTIASYSVSTMLPLRILAIASSVCFAIYGLVLQLWPLMAMELILLPINVYRFWQVLSLRATRRRSPGSEHSDFAVVKAYGKMTRMDAGSVVFARGDAVDRLYFITSGKVRIEEMDIDLIKGDILGEIGFFTDAAARTATARCTEPTELYSIDEKQFMRLQFEDPGFGLAVMRTVARRLISDVGRIQKQLANDPELAAGAT